MLDLYTRELLLFVALFSAIIGAYCTTIDYRIRQDLPLVTKNCFCPFCHHKLSGFHQIPVISWVLLGGKCHYCKKPIPARYPLIEAGFILCYCTVFLLFQERPFVYVILWFLFITVFLLLRSDRHYKSLIKGLSIMYLYHIPFALIILAINEALKIQ